MNEGLISARYSKALFLMAKEKNLIDVIKQDMLLILEIASMPQVKDLLSSPVIQNSVKRSTFHELLKGRVNDLSVNMVFLVVNNNREMYLAAIARSFINHADRHNGITKAVLTTAVEIGSAIKEKISNLIEKGLKTTVEMKEIIDPEITGGFMLQVEDIFIDGSVRSQLRKIKKELTED